MKKQLFFLAAAALALASCSSENDVVQQSPDAQQLAAEQAVDFDVYLSRGTTRAGDNGVLTTETLKDLGNVDPNHGFGVFGYYTNGESYTGSSRPDFFYNQNVYWKATAGPWTYSPIKYWPNEFGGDAISDQVDRVTLFAYAPWVDVEPLTGLVKVESGKEFNKSLNITGMTRNNATGDPLVKYVSSLIAGNSVDLCYGVAALPFTSSNSAINQNDIKQGYPYIDVVKPGTDASSKIKFDFKHATAQMVVTIDAKVVDLTSDPSDDIDVANTRIWVRSVTFEGITQSGALNLNSTAESTNWYDVNGTSLITTGSLTVHDGRKDGREANEAASSETPATLNPIIVQSAPYSATGAITATGVEAGVRKATVNLFGKQDPASGKIIKNDETSNFSPIFVIPAKEKMKVTIVYDVETADENLATYLSDGNRRGSTIENRIYKTIDTFGYIEAGKRYTLNLHLGMRSVDFDAEVSEWLDYDTDVDLPSNLQTFTANAPQTNATVKIGNKAESYAFAVSNLKAGKSITPEVTGIIASSPYSVTPTVIVNGAGIGKCEITGGSENLTPKDVDWGTVKLYDGSKAAMISITQMASPLGLTTSDITAGTTTITLTASKATGTVTADWDKAGLTVMRGTENITANCTLSGTNNVGTITLPTGEPAAADHIYTITFQTGQAPQETVTVNVN